MIAAPSPLKPSRSHPLEANPPRSQPSRPLAIPKMTAAPKIPPAICAAHAQSAWRSGILFVSRNPSVIAGLMWHPLIGPITYAMSSRAKPNANAMPSVPIASPARIALPVR